MFNKVTELKFSSFIHLQMKPLRHPQLNVVLALNNSSQVSCTVSCTIIYCDRCTVYILHKLVCVGRLELVDLRGLRNNLRRLAPLQSWRRGRRGRRGRRPRGTQELSRGAAELSVLLRADRLELVDFQRQLLFGDPIVEACTGACQCDESERE